MSDKMINLPLSPSLGRRIVRAIFYSLVILVVMISGVLFKQESIWKVSFVSEGFLHLTYAFLICFLVSLAYVNVYVLYPYPAIDESERAKRWQRSSAIQSIIILGILFFLAPTIGYIIWFWPDVMRRQKGLFAIFFLAAPSVIYMITLLARSGLFYSKKTINEKLFGFRHQLITPGMLLITTPFCISYTAFHDDISWISFGFMALIQLMYLSFCFWKTSIRIGIPIIGKSFKLNPFFVTNSLLFMFASTTAFFVPEIRFIVFGVWFGLYMTSFEFWGSVYFKLSEDEIRRLFQLPTIDLSKKYAEYYDASARAFTAIFVLFPCSYLLSAWLTYPYLLVTMSVSFVVWGLLIKELRTYSDSLFKRMRKRKFWALAFPLSIVIEALWHYVPKFDPNLRGTLITTSLAVVIFSASTLINNWSSRLADRSLHYWYAGVGLATMCLALVATYELSPQRNLSLAWPYFYSEAVVAIVLLSQLDFFKPRSGQSRHADLGADRDE